MNDKHYGTVSHWFEDYQIGAIQPDEHASQPILLAVEYLSPGYLPKIGDAVCYRLGQGENERVCATEVALSPALREGMRVKMRLHQWDFSLNGGYSLYRRHKDEPVFILGPFLRDQTRVPDDGEMLCGTLIRHDNGHWLMTDIESVVEALPEEVLQAEKTPPQTVRNVPVMSVREQAVSKVAGLPLNQVLHGEVVRWEDEQGFGFIQSGQESVFFHISAYHYRHRRPHIGEAVSFFCRLPADTGEKQRATRVVRREDQYALNQHEALRGTERMKKGRMAVYTLAAMLYLAAVAFFWWPLAAVYLVLSLAALALYGYDKSVARKNAAHSGYIGRVPETRLLVIGLFGGWPGALSARFGFNHKTTKQPFVMYFWLTAIINMALTVWLLQSEWLVKLSERWPL